MSIAMSTHPNQEHHDRITERIARRSAEYPLPPSCASIDILTLVFNTDPAILRETAASVIAQDAPVWRWVIIDNGSTDAGTHEVLRDLASHSNIVIEPLPENLGIVAGHRRGLELCIGEFVALLDHDDVLTPDALRIVAWYIDRFDRPGFLYSDEDKCDTEHRRFAPLIKPDFSPALLNDTAYTCHLSVAERTLLVGCGAFTDATVEGTQDWDMALRLVESGCAVVHVPEILYSWRALPSSTALTLSSKPYVLDAQRNCLQQHLRRQGLDDRFEVFANPMFPEPNGFWWIRRREGLPEPRVEIVVSGPMAPGQLREAVGLLELIPDAGLICTPHPDEPIDAHFRSCRRDAVTICAPWVARATALTEIGAVDNDIAANDLAANDIAANDIAANDIAANDLAGRLRSQGWRTIATPFLTAGGR